MATPGGSSTDVDSVIRGGSGGGEEIRESRLLAFEKGQPDEKEVIENIAPDEVSSTEIGMLGKAPVGDIPKDETFLACLQVVGAFFLMFNSW